MSAVKVIIDTDIGDDVDDLLAIAFAERHDEIELVGITTVFRNTLLRAHMAKYFLSEFSSAPKTPVHAGIGIPLAGEADTSAIPNQYKSEMANCAPDSEDAILFLKETLNSTRVKIVCIGPLTNIGTLIKNHPDVLSNIDEIIIMGGCYYIPSKEWNILCDPEAAAIVFESGIPLRAVGLDTTLKCALKREHLDAIDSGSERNAFILQACKDWETASTFLPVLHDPLTIHALLETGDLKFQEEEVVVELSGEHTRAMTYTRPYRMWGNVTDTPNVRVAYEVNHQRFIDYFLTKTFD